ncbi:cytochrome P450 family protein [Actinocorallia populi]|uniref:cytochrome P450 family protein n=1 Tax=Actinocorallia populi TaxID=2079200 RepID=UPI000D08D8FF|nr:cytochrome P450 [Actinocorallia populi]
MTAEIPVVVLDPTGADHHGEAARMRELGPVVRIVLPGDVPAWAVTRHDLVADLVKNPLVSKDWRRWNEIRQGRIPEGWPLIGMVAVTNMVTADGAEHHRLRRLVTQTLTPARVQALAPRVTELVAELLDRLPEHADEHGVVDVRTHFAVEVPMQVICELTGVPAERRARLRELVDSIFRTTTPPEEVVQVQTDIFRLLGDLIALRTAEPGDDLTSALIAARAADPEALSDEELAGTLWLMLAAGHETTLNLITNAIRALLTHPVQLAFVEHGEASWEDVVEETLRWDAPIGNFMARYPLEDLTVEGVTIPAGDAVLAPYSGVGRDEAQHGADAAVFDLTRTRARSLAFGGGPHLCLGAPLARMETRIALEALFARHPGLALAVPAQKLTPVESFFSNGPQTLPVVL